MRVLLVTSWNTACGIAQHSSHLKESVEKADRGIEVVPSSDLLDPESPTAVAIDLWGFQLVHLNHHDGLHSRWTPDHVRAITEHGIPVVVTYHDTTDDPSPTSKFAQLAQVASSVVVHEPLDERSGIKAIYWRQGVPAAAEHPVEYTTHNLADHWVKVIENAEAQIRIRQQGFMAYPQQPVLGTVGFNFPWKNFARLAQVTGELGWALVILSNNATEEDEQRWRASNSSILVVRKFLPQDVAINYLAGCDATAFMYECANTGTSGAIRQGIAARKPVIALKTCRQFRDLVQDRDGALWGLGHTAINWIEDWDQLRYLLQEEVMPHRYDVGVCALAYQDSWEKLGQKYAQLYRTLERKS